MKREREPSPPTVATGSSLHPDAIVAQCKSALAQLCAEHGIDESHGVKHAAADCWALARLDAAAGRTREALTDYANALLLQDWHEEQRAARRAGLVLDG